MKAQEKQHQPRETGKWEKCVCVLLIVGEIELRRVFHLWTPG